MKMEMDNQKLKEERAEMEKLLDEVFPGNETSVIEENKKMEKELKKRIDKVDREKDALHEMVIKLQKENEEMRRELDRANAEVTKGEEDKKLLETELATKENDIEKLQATNGRDFQDLQRAFNQVEEEKGELSVKCDKLANDNRCVHSIGTCACVCLRVCVYVYEDGPPA